MSKNDRDSDVRVEYKDGGFESFCTKGLDSAQAIIKVMTLVRRKQRALSVYHTIESVSVVLASHEAYSKK